MSTAPAQSLAAQSGGLPVAPLTIMAEVLFVDDSSGGTNRLTRPPGRANGMAQPATLEVL